MGKKDDHGFREVAPGILVGGGFKVKIPHPDPVWAICDPDEESFIGNSGAIYIFSSPEKAGNIIDKGVPKNSYKIKMFSWDSLVDTFGKICQSAMVDPTMEDGFCQVVPLRKGI